MTLQCITRHYNTLHDITLHHTTINYITWHYNTLHYITWQYNALQDIRIHYMTLHYITLQWITSHYNTLHDMTLQCITKHYNTLHDITLHHITIHYITLQYNTLHHITIHTYICFWSRGIAFERIQIDTLNEARRTRLWIPCTTGRIRFWSAASGELRICWARIGPALPHVWWYKYVHRYNNIILNNKINISIIIYIYILFWKNPHLG